MSFYPILNLILTNNYIDQYIMNLNELMTYFIGKTHTIEALAVNNMMIYQSLKKIPLRTD